MQEYNDRDTFSFHAKKGQRLRIEAFGHRIGSSIDTTIRARHPDGNVISTSGDSVGSDSLLTVSIPADGRYFVEIEDATMSFGPMVNYELEVAVEQPAFTLGIREVQRFSQQRKQLAVPAGNRFAVVLTAQRTDFDDAFQLDADQLPAAFKLFARPMPAGANAMPIVVEAKSLAKGDKDQNESGVKRGRDSLFGQLIDLTARSIPDSQNDLAEPVVGHFENQAQLMRVRPGNLSLKEGVVDQLAVAVLEPVPFKVNLVTPQVPISQNGRMNLRVNIQRDEGFKDPIILRLPFRPPGINANPTVKVKPNQNSIEYPINANSKAACAVWPICVTAVAPNDLGAMISTGLHDLKIVTPFVAIEGDMVSAEVNSTSIAACSVEVLKKFAGTASARLTQLPKQVTSKPQTIRQDDESIRFPITVGKGCVTGKNFSVNVQVAVKQNGHSIIFDAGKLLMRFSVCEVIKTKIQEAVDSSVRAGESTMTNPRILRTFGSIAIALACVFVFTPNPTATTVSTQPMLLPRSVL